MTRENIRNVSEGTWEIPESGKMRVPGRFFGTENIIKALEKDAVEQVKNVATLPGIVKYSIALPDVHVGYGFCIGGVGAFDLEEGIVSPGGVGFDINCGVRLVKTNLVAGEEKARLKELMRELGRQVPAGVGREGKLKLSERELKEVLESGVDWCIEKGYGWKKDSEHTEENGKMEGADSSKVSKQALKRGMPQIGTLGAGNHFIEIQEVEKIFAAKTAKSFGLEEGQLIVMIHSGSRGCGHQIASDYINVMMGAMKKYGIEVPDRQLACAPIGSKEAGDYTGALKCGINYAFANRQLMMHWMRQGFETVFKRSSEEMEIELLYDVAHNMAKEEEHSVDGKKRRLLVHRKGATRAFPSERRENPKAYKKTGHPAIIPGSMGTASYVLVGTKQGIEESFGSVCHGAGRTMSRTAALKEKSGQDVKRELEAAGKVVQANSVKGLAEEAPYAYKDIDEVVKSIELAGIGRTVARLKPLAVMKG